VAVEEAINDKDKSNHRPIGGNSGENLVAALGKLQWWLWRNSSGGSDVKEAVGRRLENTCE